MRDIRYRSKILTRLGLSGFSSVGPLLAAGRLLDAGRLLAAGRLLTVGHSFLMKRLLPVYFSFQNEATSRIISETRK